MDEYYDPTRTMFQGHPVFLSDTAFSVMVSKRMNLYDVVAILEEGVDCAPSRRRSGTVERCATYRKEWIKVVAVRDFHYSTGEECWLIRHVDETERP